MSTAVEARSPSSQPQSPAVADRLAVAAVVPAFVSRLLSTSDRSQTIKNKSRSVCCEIYDTHMNFPCNKDPEFMDRLS